MGEKVQHTDTYESRLARKNGKPPRLTRQEAGSQWRTASPSKGVLEALADFRDLCFRPPDDPNEPNMGKLSCNSALAGLALVALEALYDPEQMEKARMSGNFRDGVDVVRTAMGTLLRMEDDPDRHLYRPLSEDMPPARDPGIRLETVLSRLLAGVQADFQPELDAIKRETFGRSA